MTHAHAAVLAAALLLSAVSAGAEEAVVPASGAALNLKSALGKQVDVRFSESFAANRLASRDIDGVIIYELPPDKICLYGRGKGLEPDAPQLAEFASPSGGGDICVPLAEVSVRLPKRVEAPGAPVSPFYATDRQLCSWVWKQGKGIGLWTEDCQFDSGRWDVAYDDANDLFALRVDAGDPFPVVRHWRKDGGLTPEQLLPDLKAKGLVLDDAECVFEVSSVQAAPAGWTQWHVMPIGKRKAAYDAQPADEVPEPACGELGYAVDFIGFFMVHKDHADRVVYVNLGQDGTMIDLPSITLTE
jgi:hypothetical protein